MGLQCNWHKQNTWHLWPNVYLFLSLPPRLSFSLSSLLYSRPLYRSLPPGLWLPGTAASLCVPSREATHPPAADGAFESGEWGYCEELWVVTRVGIRLLICRPLTHTQGKLRTECQQRILNFTDLKGPLGEGAVCVCVCVCKWQSMALLSLFSPYENGCFLKFIY